VVSAAARPAHRTPGALADLVLVSIAAPPVRAASSRGLEPGRLVSTRRRGPRRRNERQMPCTVAIQPDQLTQKNGEKQSFSSRWAARAADTGVNVRTVDVYAQDFFRRLAGCDGFMWRFGYSPNPRLFAKRLLPAVEHGLGIPVFPS